MAIIKFVEVKKGNLKNVINYITNENKTSKELIYCKDCDLDNVLEQFKYIKELYSNKDGRQYYHFIQSFSPDDKVDYELANKIGQELCSYFKNYQIVMATHKDKNYIHNHFVMNSVDFETGKKHHQSVKDLENIKKLSNKLCEKYGLRQINLENSKVSKYLNSGEYHLSKKEETEKKKLIKAINKCIKSSTSKEQFIYKMNELGYKVKWQDTRKYITYTTPTNMKFRDKRLQNVKYTKERMESYFNKVNNKARIKNTIIQVSSLNKKNKENTNKSKDTAEYSDVAKKEYIKKNENASSIEWEE